MQKFNFKNCLPLSAMSFEQAGGTVQLPEPLGSPTTVQCGAVPRLATQSPFITPAPAHSLLPAHSTVDPLSSPEAECEVCSWFLRCAQSDLAIADRLLGRFADEDFASSLLRNLMRSVRHFIAKGEVSGSSAVLAYAAENRLDVGGAALLGRLVGDPIVSLTDLARIEQDVEILLEYSLKRRVRQALTNRLSQLSTQSAISVIQSMSDDVANLSRDSSYVKKEAQHISQVMQEVVSDLYGEEPRRDIFATGFRDLDVRLGGGVRDGDYLVIGGRPSMGKTAFAMGISQHMASTAVHQRPVLFYSGEMRAKALGFRMLSATTSIAASYFRDGTLTDVHGAIISQAMPAFANIDNVHQEGACRLWIDDTPGLALSEIRARTREFAQRFGRPIVVLDYLQLVKSGPNAARFGVTNKNQEIGEVSQGLKQLARELDTPVIALSQLSRDLEKRPNKIPVMSDLRESGQIEQDADIILFLYREFVYNQDALDPTEAQVIVAKQRDGMVGPVMLTFNEQLVRFEGRNALDDRNFR